MNENFEFMKYNVLPLRSAFFGAFNFDSTNLKFYNCATEPEVLSRVLCQSRVILLNVIQLEYHDETDNQISKDLKKY